MSLKRSPEWFAEHAAKMRRYKDGIGNAELVDVKRIGKPTRRAPVVQLVNADEPYPNLIIMLREAGLPDPVREYVFAGNRGYRFDYAYPSKRVALECDGGIWRKGGGAHSRPQNILRDIDKANLATMLGWRVIRATPDKLEEAVRLIRLLLEPSAA